MYTVFGSWIEKKKIWKESKVVASFGDNSMAYDAILIHPKLGYLFWGAFYTCFYDCKGKLENAIKLFNR